MSIGSYYKRPRGFFLMPSSSSRHLSFLHVIHRFDYRIASFLADVELLLVAVVVEPAVVDAFRVPATAPDGHAVLVAQVVVRFVRQPMFECWSHGGICKQAGHMWSDIFTDTRLTQADFARIVYLGRQPESRNNIMTRKSLTYRCFWRTTLETSMLLCALMCLTSVNIIFLCIIMFYQIN